MARITPIPRRKFEKFLVHVGCFYKRTKGDHLIYDRAGLKRPVVFPKDKEVTPFIVRNNLKTLGLTPEEYLEILKAI